MTPGTVRNTPANREQAIMPPDVSGRSDHPGHPAPFERLRERFQGGKIASKEVLKPLRNGKIGECRSY